jgi:hypothetical protein
MDLLSVALVVHFLFVLASLFVGGLFRLLSDLGCTVSAVVLCVAYFVTALADQSAIYLWIGLVWTVMSALWAHRFVCNA